MTADQPRPLMADPSVPEPAGADPQAAATSRPARPRLRDQVAENPLLTLFGIVTTLLGTCTIAVLVFTLGTVNARIDDTNARIDRLEERFVSLENRVIEIDRKLTALIAALNATEAVEAALEGRLLEPGTDEQDQAPAER